MEKIESRISVGKCQHQGKELDCYIPELYINGIWRSLLSPGCYILKESYNPLIICKKCAGSGQHCYMNASLELVWDAQKKCAECNGIGLRKGVPVDNIKDAQWQIKYAMKEIAEYERIKNKYFAFQTEPVDTVGSLIEQRRIARENKNWQLSDDLRNQLDEKNVFVFDTKEGQDIYYLNDAYFYEILTYKEKDEVVKETRMERTERLYEIKFPSKRKFVEWKIQQDAASEKRVESWIFSTLASVKK